MPKNVYLVLQIILILTYILTYVKVVEIKDTTNKIGNVKVHLSL